MSSGTRLVGVGRLAVEVPDEWPTTGYGAVTQCCVQIIPSVIPAVGFLPPPPGTVAIQPRAWDQQTWEEFERDWRRWPRAFKRARLGSVEAAVPKAERGPRYAFICPTLGGAFDFTGDREMAWQVFSTARELPADLVAIPELSRAHGRVDDSDPHDVDYAAQVLRQVGLAPVARDTAPTGASSWSLKIDPSEGSVVERGSEVHYLASPDPGDDE